MRLSRTSSMIATCALVVAACARAQMGSGEQGSILHATGESVDVRLLNAATTKPIANTAVEVQSDNGIRCIKAPCPTDEKQWKGTSDANGRVTIPRSALNTTANIKTAGHDGDLVGDATSDAKGLWSVDLFSDGCANLCPHPLKLHDARSHEPIANALVLIEVRGANSSEVASSTSNALGYVFVPFVIMAKGMEDSWVIVEGYRDAKIDFSAARRKMLLEPR